MSQFADMFGGGGHGSGAPGGMDQAKFAELMAKMKAGGGMPSGMHSTPTGAPHGGSPPSGAANTPTSGGAAAGPKIPPGLFTDPDFVAGMSNPAVAAAFGKFQKTMDPRYVGRGSQMIVTDVLMYFS
jgi:hypothetical protein